MVCILAWMLILTNTKIARNNGFFESIELFFIIMQAFFLYKNRLVCAFSLLIFIENHQSKLPVFYFIERYSLVVFYICLATLFSVASLASPGPHFVIRQYVIEGNHKVSSDILNAAVAVFVGDDCDFSTIQSAVSAIQQAYKDAGYETVRVVIPKQEVDSGLVHLQVIEALLGTVEVQGNKFYDESNVRHALSSLKEGDVPNIKSLASDLRLSNENNAKQTQVTFRLGDDPHKVNAVANVVDDTPWHAAASLDNTGTDQTGNWRLGMAFMHANVLNLDQMLSAQFVTSPDRIGDVQIFGMNYRIPLYGIGDELEFSAGHSNVNSGIVNTTAGSYGISGSGESIGGHYIHFLPRFLDLDHRINIGFDYRTYHNSVTLQGQNGTSLVPDTEVHPLSANYIGFIRQAEREWGVNLGVYQNIPGGVNGDNASIQLARHGAKADYTLFRYSLNVTQSLPKQWQIHAEFNGQYTNDALISGEQFGIGGINSVRGFQERTQSNDKGMRAALELYTPDIGYLIDFANIELRALAFYNVANAWRNDALPGEITHNHLSSIGLGFRGSVSKHVHLRLDLANLLDTGGVNTVGQKHVQASVIYLY